MVRRRNTADSLIQITVAALLVLTAACERIDPSGGAGQDAMSMARARAYTDRLASAPADVLTDTQIVALGYLERARTGLGSPFRLIDFALSDPYLDSESRLAVALNLLARAQEGRTYDIDPRVLDLLRLAGVTGQAGSGVYQLELIERAIGTAPTADSGERIVRLGYQLAIAERTVSTSFPSVVAHVAALVADRRRAREDANRLVTAARAARLSPIELLPQWRADRRLTVEGPALTSLHISEEQSIAIQGEKMALAIRALAQRLSASNGTSIDPLAGGSHPPTSLLTPEAATRLLEIAARRDLPPQGPISVALLINRDSYVSAMGSDPARSDLRRAFADSTFNEEQFAAAVILQDTVPVGDRMRLHLIRLQAAVFFRVWNQEEPWFPGDGAPATKDLVARFALAGIEFGPDVPEAWRPYFRRMLAIGLTDLQRVLPTASLRGLTVRFDELPGDRRALALHDPGMRTLYLPPRTGAGTLAHEIAHDLDWQLARSRYGKRGYATDLAVSRGRGDRIAYALTGLAASLTQPDSLRKPHDTRPTEVFARGTDWFVAALLAREGIAGGYLTSFQDPVLTGYGTTRGPDVGGGAVGSLVEILSTVAPVSPVSVEWATRTYGPQRRLTPIELTGAVTGAGAGLPAAERFQAIAETRDRSLGFLDNAVCRLTSAVSLRRLSAAQRGLIDAAAGAAARGAAIDAARQLGAGAAVSGTLTDAWMSARLYGAPEPADSALAMLEPALEELVYRVRTLQQGSTVELVDVFHFTPQVQFCGGNPFASATIPRRAPRASSQN